jgi:hypothetical protein
MVVAVARPRQSKVSVTGSVVMATPFATLKVRVSVAPSPLKSIVTR